MGVRLQSQDFMENIRCRLPSTAARPETHHPPVLPHLPDLQLPPGGKASPAVAELEGAANMKLMMDAAPANKERGSSVKPPETAVKGVSQITMTLRRAHNGNSRTAPATWATEAVAR